MGTLAGRAYLIFRGEDSTFLSQAVLVVKTALCASKRDITGTLVIVITTEMVDSLISKLSRFCDFMEKDAP